MDPNFSPLRKINRKQIREFYSLTEQSRAGQVEGKSCEVTRGTEVNSAVSSRNILLRTMTVHTINAPLDEQSLQYEAHSQHSCCYCCLSECWMHDVRSAHAKKENNGNPPQKSFWCLEFVKSNSICEIKVAHAMQYGHCTDLHKYTCFANNFYSFFLACTVDGNLLRNNNQRRTGEQ